MKFRERLFTLYFLLCSFHGRIPQDGFSHQWPGKDLCNGGQGL